MRELKFRKTFQQKIPLLVISFDDGYETDLTIAFKEMRKRGLLGTSFITTNWVGKNIGMMTYDQVRFMKSRGWDIQCHTHTHPHLATAITLEEVHQQMQDVNAVFTREGLGVPEHHAYPYGEYSPEVRDVIAQYRKSQRTTGHINTPLNDYDSINHHELWGYSMDTGTQSKHDEVKLRIDEAISNNQILVLYGHRLTNELPLPDYSNNIDFFIKVLDYAIEKGIRVVTEKQMYEMTSA